MTTTDPLSLAQTKRLATEADTILLRATRPADLETPIGAFLRLDDGGPAYLLESVEGGERLGRYSFLGVGPRRLLEVRDGLARTQTRPVTVPTYAPDLPIDTSPASDPLDAIRAFVPRRRVLPVEGMPRFTGGAVGALAYDAVSTFEPTVPLPERDPVGVPIGGVHRDRPRPRLRPPDPHAVRGRVAAHRGARPRGPLPDRRGGDLRRARPCRAPVRGRDRGRGAPDRGRGPPSSPAPVETSLGRDAYIHAVEVAKEAIASGEAIQVVLARRQSFDLPGDPETGRTLDGIGLYRALRRVNPSPYLFFVRTPTFEVVGASPELLLQVEGDKLTTHPIAGTRPRGADAREDALLAEQLQRDPKERAEHVMLVDLGRNDLGRVSRAGTVTVSKYMEVESYSHVLHLVSHVEGRLRPDLDALDALRAVFPAGTLSGAPKVRAMQLIAAAEGERRGLYGGAVGLSRLRRQPRHGHHHPERGAQGRPGARPHGRGHRRRLRAGARVRGDRPQGRRHPPRDRPGRGRPRRAGRRRRRRRRSPSP